MLHSEATSHIDGAFNSEIINLNSYKIAAQEQFCELKKRIREHFYFVVCISEFIDATSGDCVKPIFDLAASGLRALMDKLPVRGKMGNAPFAQPGIRYGGENGRHFLNRQAVAA